MKPHRTTISYNMNTAYTRWVHFYIKGDTQACLELSKIYPFHWEKIEQLDPIHWHFIATFSVKPNTLHICMFVCFPKSGLEVFKMLWISLPEIDDQWKIELCCHIFCILSAGCGLIYNSQAGWCKLPTGGIHVYDDISFFSSWVRFSQHATALSS